MMEAGKEDNMKIEGKEVKIGDYVGFKSDIEQSGKIVQIHRNGVITLYSEHGFQGDYIGGQQYTDVSPEDCWVD